MTFDDDTTILTLLIRAVRKHEGTHPNFPELHCTISSNEDREPRVEFENGKNSSSVRFTLESRSVLGEGWRANDHRERLRYSFSNYSRKMGLEDLVRKLTQEVVAFFEPPVEEGGRPLWANPQSLVGGHSWVLPLEN